MGDSQADWAEMDKQRRLQDRCKTDPEWAAVRIASLQQQLQAKQFELDEARDDLANIAELLASKTESPTTPEPGTE